MKPVLALLVALCFVGTTDAQVQIPSRTIFDSQLKPPKSFNEFRAEYDEAEARKLQLKQQFEALRAARAQADIAESQARRAAQEDRNRQAPVAAAPPPKNSEQDDQAMREWLKAAGPRLHLFPDFDKVVYANDVSITIEMIRLMAGSPYAADIAYYFGTHKTESLAVSQMPLLEAARAVSAIEARVKK